MQRFNKVIFYLTVFLSVFMPFRELIALYTSSYIKFLPDLLIWPLFFVFVVLSRFRLKFRCFDLAFLGFLGVGLISTLLNGSSLLAFALQLRSITTFYVYFYLCRNLEFKESEIKIIRRMLCSVVLVLTAFAIIEYLFNKQILFPTLWREGIVAELNYLRVYSLMNNPNTFAFFCLLCMAFIYITKKGSLKTRHFAFFSVGLLNILFSASRSTLILAVPFFLILFAGFLLRCKFKKAVYTLLSVALAVGMVAVAAPIKNAIQSNIKISANENIGETAEGEKTDSAPQSTEEESEDNLTAEEKSPSFNPEGGVAIIDRLDEFSSNQVLKDSDTNGRIGVIKKGLKIWGDHPVFGTGFGTFGSAGSRMVTPEIYGEYNLPKDLYSDNEYIKVLVETGIVGSAVYIAFLILFLGYCLKNKKALLLFASILFMGMFYNIFEMQVLCFVFYLALSIIRNGIAKENTKNI